MIMVQIHTCLFLQRFYQNLQSAFDVLGFLLPLALPCLSIPRFALSWFQHVAFLGTLTLTNLFKPTISPRQFSPRPDWYAKRSMQWLWGTNPAFRNSCKCSFSLHFSHEQPLNTKYVGKSLLSYIRHLK